MDVFSYGDIGGYCELHKKRLSSLVDHLSPLQSWAPEIRFFKRFDFRYIFFRLFRYRLSFYERTRSIVGDW